VRWRAISAGPLDEDEEVRDATAAAAAAATGVAPDTQTEEALRRSFAVAAVRLARWPPYERYLVRAAGGAPIRSAALREVIAGVDLVRRLFDREADNHHAEALLLSQLAAAALRRGGTIRRSAAEAALDASLGSAEEAAAALGPTGGPAGGEAGGAGGTGSGAGNSQWAGGATNHESAFLPVCRVCLALWALAPACAPLSQGAASRVEALAASFAAVEMGPMARAMWGAARWALIGAAPGTGIGAGADEADDVVDVFTNLNPCFLLE
jgi:hypothetical protein